MTRHHFHVDLRQERAAAEIAGSYALLIVLTFGLFGAIWVASTQWERVTDQEQMAIDWRLR